MRSFFLISVLLVVGSSVFAQIYLGPKVNVHHSWIRIEDTMTSDATEMELRLGFGAGGAFFLPMTDNLNLYGELGYMRKGKDSYREDFDIADVATYHFASSRLALVIELTRGPIRPYLALGPYFDYWVAGSGEYQIGARSVSDPFQVDYDINFDGEDSDISTFNVADANRLMLGAEFSIGTLIKTGPGQQLMVGAFFEFGHSFFGEAAEVLDTNAEIEHLSEASPMLVGFKAAWLFQRLRKNKTNRRDGNQKPQGKERAVKPVKKRKIKN